MHDVSLAGCLCILPSSDHSTQGNGDDCNHWIQRECRGRSVVVEGKM